MPFTYFTDEQKLRAKQDALNNIKSKTVGNGQRGTARWAIKQEISQSHELVPLTYEGVPLFEQFY